MTRRITWLVAATTSAVVIAFVAPLLLLVVGLAQDRSAGSAREQARSVSTLVATLEDTDQLRTAVQGAAGQRPPVVVVRPDDSVLGSLSDTVPADGDPAVSGADTLDDAVRDEVRQARQERAAFTVRGPDGIDAVVPVATTDGVSVVVARVPQDEVYDSVPLAWGLIGSLAVVLVGGSVLAARHLGRRVTEPVLEVADVAHRLRAGDASARAVPGGPPETQELGQALNALAERIHDLVAAEREHVADLGHRLRTPVTALRLDADLVSDPEVAARLTGHVDHLTASIDEIVREARRPLREELVGRGDLVEAVRGRLAFWQPLAEDQERRIGAEQSPTPLPVGASRLVLDELVDTLLDNVFAHTPEGTDARVTTRRDGDLAVLLVEDAGSGPVQPWQGRGTSGTGSTGLGLDIVHRTAREAGGSVALEQSVLGGLKVRVDLPLVEPD